MESLDPEALGDLYAESVRPRVARLLKVLKLDVVYTRAEGDRMEYSDGKTTRSVIDMLGGFGSTLLGHNNPELVQALKGTLDAGLPVHAQASIRTGAAFVAEKLNHLMRTHGGDRRPFIVTLCNSGAEAVEAALKHALMEWNERRRALIEKLELLRSEPGSDERRIDSFIEKLLALQPAVVAVQGSFHGKTAGSVSVTTNMEFRGMYSSSPVRPIFFARNEDLESARRELDECIARSPLAGVPGFSSVAAVLFEAVQGEGGIQCLTPEFAGVLATVAREHSAPLVADEIQCGLFRTGSFLAAHALGVKPDYVLLGKSLGGGLAKISALLVATERYNEKFGFVHTSTFAEDELSSRVALKTLEVLERDAGRIRESGARFEQAIREGVAAIQKKYPGVLNGSRGRGFLVGVEFNFTDSSEIPTIIHTIHQAGFAGYIYTSFLLNRHGIRVGVTLSRPDTLRLEPSALIQPESVARFLEALEDLCRLIHARKLVDLTRHFWNQEFTPRVLDTVSPVRYPAVRSREKLRKVGFLCHLIDDLHVKLMDPFLRNIGEEARNRFQTKLGAIAGPVLFHEQLVEGAGGKQIHLHCYGVYLQSKFFEKSHRAGDGLAMQQVTSMAERAARDGMDFVGLGQYTSIVSRNGLLLRRTGLNLTTGNGLTAGYAYQALVQAARDTGRELSELRIGVVGAAGNICCALTQVIADKAREVLLVFREGTEESQRAKDTHKAIVMGSSIDPARLSSSGRIADLKDCDVVVMGTSSAESVLFPEHLKENAIVLDVSVPSNIDERVYKERPDVKCYHGGRAKLPLGQNLRSDWLPAPVGETYACLGETICGGLVGHAGHLSYGVLTKATVLRTLELAKQVGMEMGTLRRVTRA